MTTPTAPHYLFLTTSTREPGHTGNTEWLARQAAAAARSRCDRCSATLR